jgi:hypothetical protein
VYESWFKLHYSAKQHIGHRRAGSDGRSSVYDSHDSECEGYIPISEANWLIDATNFRHDGRFDHDDIEDIITQELFKESTCWYRGKHCKKIRSIRLTGPIDYDMSQIVRYVKKMGPIWKEDRENAYIKAREDARVAAEKQKAADIALHVQYAEMRRIETERISKMMYVDGKKKCRYGLHCHKFKNIHDVTNIEHNNQFCHVAKHPCKYGLQCRTYTNKRHPYHHVHNTDYSHY